MKIAILALGSRGDVQPFVALAVALQQEGHAVTIAAAADYRALVTAYGIPFAPIAGYVSELMDFALVNKLLDGAANPLYFARIFLLELDPLMVRIMADCQQMVHEAELLIGSTLGIYLGVQLVEAHPCPFVAAHMHPLFSNPATPHVNFPAAPTWLPGRGVYHRLTHHLGWHGMWQLLRGPLNRVRTQVLGLPPLSPWQLYRRAQEPIPTLYAYSALVAPAPADQSLPSDATITGYWQLPSPPAWQPPMPLSDFLQGGPPPVLISFGSILGGTAPDRMTRLLVDALAATGARGLIYRGWGDLGNIDLPPTVMAIDAVPHDWLFPRLAAVVHHGGAGVTATALRTGLPQVVIPVFGDQQLWGERVHALHCAPAPIARGKLTAAKLAAAIQQATTDPTIRAGVARMQGRLQQEDGVAVAVEWLTTHSHAPRRVQPLMGRRASILHFHAERRNER